VFFSSGDSVLGGFCPGGLCPGDFVHYVRGDFVRFPMNGDLTGEAMIGTIVLILQYIMHV